MAYQKTIWENNITQLSAENMNHIEDGIENLESKITGLIQFKSFDVDVQTSDATANTAVYHLTAEDIPSGYGDPIIINTRISGKGYNDSNPASSQHHCFVYNVYYTKATTSTDSGERLVAYFKNTSSSIAKITITFEVMFIRNLTIQ